MKLNQSTLTRLLFLAIAVTVVQMLLSGYVYPSLGYTTQNLFSISPQTALASTQIGDKLIGYLSGIIPIDLGNFAHWIALFLSAMALLYVGYVIYEQKWAWKGRNESQRLWAVMLYGTIVLYFVLLLAKLGTVASIPLTASAYPIWGSLLIGLAINYGIVAGIVVALASMKVFDFLRI
jgi:hypothetical protein